MISFWQAFALGATAAVILFTATWMLSRKLDNYSFVDVTWSYGMAVLAPLYALLSHGFAARKWLAFTMAAVWSLRLGTYLLIRVAGHHPHEDVRYQVLRKKWAGFLGSKFFAFFQGQALILVLLSVPFLITMRNAAPQIEFIEWIGAGVWLVGICGEALSDAQMKAFKRDPANKGKVCNAGLWKLSRHPNYFFESVIWFGFWLFACGSPMGWVTVFAPLMILYFLLRVTGIPLTEKTSLESKGDAYREYQRTTSAFIPWFPKSS